MTQIRATIGKGNEVRTIGVVGVDRVLRNIDALGARLERAMDAALIQVGEQIMGDAKDEVPVDDGHLKGSGFVQSYSEIGTRTMVVRPVFGGVAAPYAYRQHETPPFEHVYEGQVRSGYRHNPGQKWKYLEDPARKHFETLENTIAQHLRSVLR